MNTYYQGLQGAEHTLPVKDWTDVASCRFDCKHQNFSGNRFLLLFVCMFSDITIQYKRIGSAINCYATERNLRKREARFFFVKFVFIKFAKNCCFQMAALIAYCCFEKCNVIFFPEHIKLLRSGICYSVCLNNFTLEFQWVQWYVLLKQTDICSFLFKIMLISRCKNKTENERVCCWFTQHEHHKRTMIASLWKMWSCPCA
jgi:hypothetical protein